MSACGGVSHCPPQAGLGSLVIEVRDHLSNSEYIVAGVFLLAKLRYHTLCLPAGCTHLRSTSFAGHIILQQLRPLVLQRVQRANAKRWPWRWSSRARRRRRRRRSPQALP